jgi:carotenoid cleavage dioxygenase-like enzyme
VLSAKATEALGRAPIPGPGAGGRDGEVNTHFTTAAGKLYALVAAGNLPVELDERGPEFPRINGAFAGRPYRYGYTARSSITARPHGDTAPGRPDADAGPAIKHDLERQSSEVHDYGPGRVTAEPVFVPRPDADAVAEDEGWILSYVYDAGRDRSDVVILDARDFGGDPVATIRLPVRVFYGFHGGWVPDGSPIPPVA